MTSKVFLPNSVIFNKTLTDWKQRINDNGYPYGIIIAKRGAVNSFYVSELSTKFVDQSACQYIANPLTNEHEYLLAGEYCRLWMKKLYPPFTVSRAYNGIKQRVPNFYCGKFINRELVYFDLIGAYHQIYSKLWLDFCEIGMKCRYPLSEIANELSSWKAARNSVVGNLASNQACLISGNQWKYVSTWSKNSKHYNHMIMWFVNRCLTELANQALRLGCCYIATDGFIFPSSQGWRKFFDILNGYNLKFRCISGEGSILRFAAYSVEGVALAGNKTIANTKTFERVFQTYLDNPLPADDPRKDKLVRNWNKPLKHVDKISNDDCLNWWSKLK